MSGVTPAANFLPILFWWLFLVPGPGSVPRLHSDNLKQRNKLELTVSWLTVFCRPGLLAQQLGIRIVFHKRGLQKHWTNSYSSDSYFVIHCFKGESTTTTTVCFCCNILYMSWLRTESCCTILKDDEEDILFCAVIVWISNVKRSSPRDTQKVIFSRKSTWMVMMKKWQPGSTPLGPFCFGFLIERPH